MEIIGKLKPANYWEWRTLIAEMQNANLELKAKEHLLALMEKDLELYRLKTAMFKRDMESSKERVVQTKNDYEEYKKKLETKIKHSLNNCVIDDISHEVRKID